MKRTPLFELHEEAGARFVPFAGYEMPVQYAGVIAEHHCVRESAGLFDVSHMGEIFVEGADAEQFLSEVTPNDVKSLVDGKAQYSALLNDNGGVIDDLIIYRFRQDSFLLCVNAANVDAAFSWLESKQGGRDLSVKNESENWAQIAIQGPKAVKTLRAVVSDLPEVEGFHFVEHKLFGVRGIFARTGYTGEDGFEIFLPNDAAPKLWTALLDAGKEDGVMPIGLGARDSLRLEPCYPLHGHELGEDISALESGLGWIVKFDKGDDFIGRSALLKQKEAGVPRKLRGFFISDRGLARHGDKVFNASGEEIGVVTSGTKTPTVNKALGLALLRTSDAAIGESVEIEVRGRRLAAELVKTPFYKRAS